MKRRLLVLGGSPSQVAFIRRAKERGLHVITCDYLPQNPGHLLADEYHNVSTIDKEGVLALARRLGIDAVASFASDTAMQTVAYVAEALGLPGPPLKAIVQLTEKDHFRALIERTELRTPARVVLAEDDLQRLGEVAAALRASGMRHIVKPVDSCGSKGITVMPASLDGLEEAVRLALSRSIGGRCIIEQYIDGRHVHGDGYLLDGKLVYHYLGDQLFYTRTQNSIPISTQWPSRHGPEVISEIVRQVEQICGAAGLMCGAVNIEARVANDGQVYIIEIGPRNGGHFIPLIQQQLTGFDFVGRALDDALGIQEPISMDREVRRPGALVELHADHDGHLGAVFVSEELKPSILALELFVKVGDRVHQHRGSHTSIGVVSLAFSSSSEGDRFMDAISEHLRVEVSPSE